jgi:hypothetical protein
MNFGTIMSSIINLFYSSSPRLSYVENGRSGYIYYMEGFTKISFYYEFGGGDCQLCIDIPDEIKWEKETKTPLSKRIEILHFVSKNVVKDKFSIGRRYEIDKHWINIY